MAVFFPDKLKNNSDSFPILEANDKQIRGLGIFDTIAERDALPVNLQTVGYIAMVDGAGYYFKGGTWTSEDDWVEFPIGRGGTKYSVLNKVSDEDYDFEWTESPQFETLNISRWSNTSKNTLKFFRSRGTDHTNEPTQDNDVLGEILFTGVDFTDNESTAGKIVFTQTGADEYDGSIPSKFELFVGTESGDAVALTANSERVVSLSTLDSEPTAVKGGLYTDASSLLYFGV